MITLNTMRKQVLEAINQYDNYSNIDLRYIDDLIAQKRVTYLRQDEGKNRILDNGFIQNLGCVELELVDRIEENCEDISSDCYLFKTVKPIPNAIEGYHRKFLTKISTLDILDIPINFIDFDEAPYAGNGRFNKGLLNAFLKDYNNHLYLFWNKNSANLLLKYITIYGAFEDPKEVGKFVKKDGSPCWTPDSPYPINRWMWDNIIKKEIIQELILKLQLPQDGVNDSRDTINTQVNTPKLDNNEN